MVALAVLVGGLARAEDDKPNVSVEIIGPAQESVSLADVNNGKVTIQIHLENKSEEKVAIFPYASLAVRDSDGSRVDTNMNLGRWGSVQYRCMLKNIPWLVLEPNERKVWTESISGWGRDYNSIIGFTLPKPGEYTLTVTVKSKTPGDICNGKCGEHDKDGPWTLAVPIDVTETIAIKVTE
jgi:hypothetical protein